MCQLYIKTHNVMKHKYYSNNKVLDIVYKNTDKLKIHDK